MRNSIAIAGTIAVLVPLPLTLLEKPLEFRGTAARTGMLSSAKTSDGVRKKRTRVLDSEGHAKR
jgi:hypothetical protein